MNDAFQELGVWTELGGLNEYLDSVLDVVGWSGDAGLEEASDGLMVSSLSLFFSLMGGLRFVYFGFGVLGLFVLGFLGAFFGTNFACSEGGEGYLGLGLDGEFFGFFLELLNFLFLLVFRFCFKKVIGWAGYDVHIIELDLLKESCFELFKWVFSLSDDFIRH